MPTTASQAAEIITTAYKQTAQQNGDWVNLSRIWRAPVMEAHDLSLAELTAGVLHLHRTRDDFHAAPETNQKIITREMDEAAIRMGGIRCHIITFTR